MVMYSHPILILYSHGLTVNIQQKIWWAWRASLNSKSMYYHWTDSVNLPAPQIHNASYWNPHVYSLGLLRQSWNKNASSVLHIAIWPQTFCKNRLPFAKRAAMERAGPSSSLQGSLLATDPVLSSHCRAFMEPSVKRKTPESSLEVWAMIELNI